MTDRAIVITFESDSSGSAANQREIDAVNAARSAGYRVIASDRIPGATPSNLSDSKARSLLRGRADAIAFHNGQSVRTIRTA